LQGVGCTASIVSAGNGWGGCTLADTTATATAFRFNHVSGTAAVRSESNSLATGYFAWGYDTRTGNDAALTNPSYQRVNTATDYDTTGFVHYLAFDGTDDSLQTPAIDFSGVNKMTVWAGVTKLSDAAGAIAVELTANGGTTNGGFFLSAPHTAAATNYGASLTGTATAVCQLSPFNSPVTNVLSVGMDIANVTLGGSITPTRANGATPTQAYSGVGVAGTVFANAALNIGRRNNTSAPYNGRMTSLIVRGTTVATSAGLVQQTEQYCARLNGQSFAST